MKPGSLVNSDLVGGLIALAISGAVIVASRSYGLGSVLSMGPGYFPTLLGLVLCGLGLALLLRGVIAPRERLKRPPLRSLLFVGAAVVLFALTLLRYGLAPATILLVVVASFASPAWSARAIAISAILVAIFAYLIFIRLLGMNVAVFAW